MCCEFCTKTFARNEALTRHIKDLHELSGKFACGFCDKKYSKSRDKIVHEKKHTGEKPYHCENCDKGWSQYMAKKTEFKCETCRSSLLKVDSPVIAEKHANLVPEKKDDNLVSDNTCTNNTNMNLGQESKNEDFKAENYFEEKEHACKKCSKTFPLQAKLTLHVRKDHSFLAERGISSSTLVCNQCEKKFSRRKNLKEHIRLVHEKEMNYLCRFCNQPFARKPYKS